MEMEKPIDSGEEMMEIDEIAEEDEYEDDTNQIDALEELDDLDDVLATPSQIPVTPSVPSSPPKPLKTYTKYVPSSALAKIAPKPSTMRTIASSSSTVVPNQQIVIINSQQIRLGNQSLLQLNKTPTLAAKPVVAGGTPGIVNITPKSTIVNSNALGRFIVKSASGQRIMLTTPPTAIKMTSTVTTSTVTVSSLAANNRPPIQRPLAVGNVQRIGLITSKKPNGSATVVTTPSTQPASTTVVMSLQASTIPSPTIVPSNAIKLATVGSSSTTSAATPSSSTMVKTVPATTSTGQSQKIVVQTAGGIQRQVVLPAHLYKLAQQGQIKAVSYTGKSFQYVRVNPKGPVANIQAVTTQPQVTPATTSTVTSVTKTPHPVKLIQTISKLDSSITGSSSIRPTMKPANFQAIMPPKRVTPSTATTSTRMSNPVKQETERPVSTAASSIGGYRLLNAIGGISAGLTTKNTVVGNKFKTLGSTQYAKNQVKEEQMDGIEIPHSFGSPRKYQQIQHNLKYEGGDFYQNAVSASAVTIKAQPPSPPAASAPAVADGLRRKHCNCTKSQCLKLYCDCFANGEFCFNCNCKECFNNLENEDEREKAIKMCLDRNPMAFKPKIGKVKDQTDTLRRHTKGCNCKRSGCLKNYCECYEAKIACSENCKCIDCRNIEDSDGHFDDGQRHNAHTISSNSSMAGTSASAKLNILNTSGTAMTKFEEHAAPDSPTLFAKKPCNFMTQDVIEATIQCVVAQADECQKSNLDAKSSERLILEEFGRCLVEIIEFSLKNTDN